MSLTNKIIGGEIELKSDNLYYECSNSGRSSLRLIIQTLRLENKKILLPDFLCQTIIDVFNEYNICYDFYSVNIDLEFSFPENIDEYDAFYAIRYFGHNSLSLKKLSLVNCKKIIFDDVFSFEPKKLNFKNSDVHWFSFNSLRKTSYIADFSKIISNKPINGVIKKELKNFEKFKYLAKKNKFNYLYNGLGSEKKYLNKFNQAELLLDLDTNVNQPSAKSIGLLSVFFCNQKEELNIRFENLKYLKNCLKKSLYINIKPETPSFLPIFIDNRNMVREILMKEKIFLAIHWPEIIGIDNKLSKNILSIPLDSRYLKKDFDRIIHIINSLDN